MGRPSKPAANRSHPYRKRLKSSIEHHIRLRQLLDHNDVTVDGGAPARAAVPAPRRRRPHVRVPAAARKHFKTPATRPPPPARVGGRTLMYVSVVITPTGRVAPTADVVPIFPFA
ncbi:hypothetical protein EVAR_83920_1 [Eumeta japonica]|uniref:Uncharacterized protein n=1 Tax=Eumeta variegata TaxID=151549 RepID=A0A4C1URE1_EUMVA|nr:hypothetical protein EVAR_83920_1 [Eumeta japonica]